jgi:hypothetical protein
MMSKFNDAGQLTALLTTIFQTIQDWNTAHPQRLPSHRECAAINITQTYTDGSETPKYAIANMGRSINDPATYSRHDRRCDRFFQRSSC